MTKAYEFDCRECGRHIIVIIGPLTEVCNACRIMPGWWHDPELTKTLDPNHLRNPPPSQRN